MWDEMGKLKTKVDNNAFDSELDFQEALTKIIGSVHDGHLALQLDVINVFSFGRSFSLVSVSMDGQKLPQVYDVGEYL